jgi:hypothetical protein
MLLERVVLQVQRPGGLVQPVRLGECHGFRPEFLGESLTTLLPAAPLRELARRCGEPTTWVRGSAVGENVFG